MLDRDSFQMLNLLYRRSDRFRLADDALGGREERLSERSAYSALWGLTSCCPHGDALTELVPRSAAPYRGVNLRLYDLFVLHFTSPRAWGCTADELSQMYRRHLSHDHAEVGVGSGYFLSNHGRTDWTQVSLIDPNPATLQYVSRRLTTPAVNRHVADILDATTLPQQRYKSVGANYVLHCLDATGDSKRTAIANLARLTADDGTLFGATVLGDAEHNRLGQVLMRICNATGAFNNTTDDEASLRQHLSAHFHTVHVERRRAVAMFTATGPIR